MLLLDNLIHRLLVRVQLQDVLFAFQNFARVVSYVQHCGCAAVSYQIHKLKDFAAVIFVQAVARLIQNKDFWSFYSRTQNEDGALLAVTEVAEVF